MTSRLGSSPWVRSPAKRAFDTTLALLSLPIALPLAGVAAAVVWLTMGAPILFVQERIGLDGRSFRVFKFKTMKSGSSGPPITGRGDPRVTTFGRWLRHSKIDELPQLVNILRGEMAIVGPRPEVPRYVALYDDQQRKVLDARPGLTDPATLEFRDEERLLGSVPEAEREAFYVRDVMPRKLRLNLDYQVRASLRGDLVLIARTIVAILRGDRS
jgi:lipopolysaccharide/colanic/teichoic acid biosynthesis glycosyltransferase